jgi:peptidyl-prolyl cis-trans isomerase B (cyclophilin B)
MQQKATRPAIKIESDNGLKNERGTIAMARTPDPNSATAQFFINSVDNAFLNFTAKTEKGWGYAVFGKVVQGIEVVDEISKVKTGARDVPVEAITITTGKGGKISEKVPPPLDPLPPTRKSWAEQPGKVTGCARHEGSMH